MAAPACVTADLTKQRRYSGQRNYIPGRVPHAPTSRPRNRSSSKLPRDVCKHEKEQSPRIQTSPLEESCGLCEQGSNRSGYLGAKPVNIRLSVCPRWSSGRGGTRTPGPTAGGGANVCGRPSRAASLGLPRGGGASRFPGPSAQAQNR